MRKSTIVTCVPKDNDLLCTIRMSNGKLIKVKRPFQPYFYAPKSSDQKLKPIEKKSNLEQIYVRHPSEVNKLRERYDKGHGFTYESDVLYDIRYMIDNRKMINDEIEWSISWIDIEANLKNEYGKKCNIHEIKNGSTEITAITRLDTLHKKIFVYSTTDFDEDLLYKSIKDKQVTKLNKSGIDNEKTRKDKEKLAQILDEFDLVIYKNKTEKEMLESFLADLHKYETDVITGWNVHFDYITIFNRCKYHNLLDRLSYFKGELPYYREIELFDKNQKRTGTMYKYWTPGYYVMDYLEIYRKRNLKDEKSWTLDYITRKHKVIAPKVKHNYGNDFDRFYREDPNTFIYYNVIDVISLYLVDKDTDFMSISKSICNASHIPFVYCTSNRFIVDGYLITNLEENGLVRITPHSKYSDKISGAYVACIKGFHECYFCDLDFSCHPKGTKVLVRNKGEIDISEVKEGDYVYGIDGWHKVLKKHEYDVETLLIDIIIGNKKLYSTAKHKIPIFNTDETFVDWTSFWIAYMHEFFGNDLPIVKTTEGLKRVDAFDIIPYKGKVYDLTLEGRPYYFANGILTHNSMYPNIMIALNVSPETYIEPHELSEYEDKDIIKSPTGTYFRKDKMGIVPELLKRLFIERKTHKKQALEHLNNYKRTNDINEYKKFKLYWNKQLTEKTILNSFYGVMSDPKYSLYKPEIGGTVTGTGQHLIKYARNYLNENGYTVLYTDTDSVYIKLKDHNYKEFNKDIEKEDIADCLIEINKIYNNINKTFEDLANEWNCIENRFEMKTELLGRNIFIMEKKMYSYIELLGEDEFGELSKMGYSTKNDIVKWIEQKDFVISDDRMIIKGMPIIKSVIPEIVSKYMKRSLFLLLVGKWDRNIFSMMLNEIWKSKIVPEAQKNPLLLAKTIKKNKEPDGNNKEWQAILRYNETHDIPIELGEKVYCMKTATPEKVVVWKMNEEPPKIKIDWEAMYESDYKNLRDQFMRVININTKRR
jgi:DNA polymerase elongation subunit (family B)